MESIATLENHIAVNRPMSPCPECKGRGYLPVTVTETMTYEDGTRVRIPCDTTVTCWRCGGRRRVERQ
jgi:hypothetical protein